MVYTLNLYNVISQTYFNYVYCLVVYFIYLFRLHWVLVAARRIFVEACRIFCCGTQASL